MKLIKILNIIDVLVSNRIIKWIIVPCLFLLLWFSFSLMYSSYKSFTVLQYPQNQDVKNNFFEKKLLRGQKLSGEFEAKENNLGIIAVRFGRVPKVNFNKENRILFRIREKGQAAWFYENEYKSGLVRSYQYLTFGFVPVQNSKGKIYQFEIVSLNGNINNAMETNDTNPVYLSKYKFSKSEVFKNRNSVIKFMANKIFTFYTDYDTLVSSSVFLLPFIFYLTWIIIITRIVDYNSISSHSKGIERILKIILNKYIFTFLVLALIFNDVIFFQDLITGFMLGLLGFWIFAIYLNNFKSKVTFILSFIIILLSVLSIYFNWEIFIDKASTYAFMFIAIGLLQILLEYKTTYVKK